VSFRASASDEARALGLQGWVRNLSDGRVESIAEGPQEKLDAFVAWCKRGPDEARVDDVGVQWEEPKNEFQSFGVRR
jgi:acylphosphatase